MRTLCQWLDWHRARFPDTAAFAATLGVSVSLLRAWRRHDRTPSPAARDRMEAALTLSPEEMALLRRLCDEADRDRRSRVTLPTRSGSPSPCGA